MALGAAFAEALATFSACGEEGVSIGVGIRCVGGEDRGCWDGESDSEGLVNRNVWHDIGGCGCR